MEAILKNQFRHVSLADSGTSAGVKLAVNTNHSFIATLKTRSDRIKTNKETYWQNKETYRFNCVANQNFISAGMMQKQLHELTDFPILTELK